MTGRGGVEGLIAEMNPVSHEPVPVRLDLKRDTALTVRWSDGRVSIYPVRYLRKMSPSAEARQMREELAKNPLTVLPATAGGSGALTAESIEKVGRYAVRIRFSDGHDTGIYSWNYLRSIDPNRPETTPGEAAERGSPDGGNP